MQVFATSLQVSFGALKDTLKLKTRLKYLKTKVFFFAFYYLYTDISVLYNKQCL